MIGPNDRREGCPARRQRSQGYRTLCCRHLSGRQTTLFWTNNPSVGLPRRRPCWTGGGSCINMAIVGLGLWGKVLMRPYAETVRGEGSFLLTLAGAGCTGTAGTVGTEVPGFGTIALSSLDGRTFIETGVWGGVRANQIGTVSAAGKGRTGAEGLAKTLDGTVMAAIEFLARHQIETSQETEADLARVCSRVLSIPGAELASRAGRLEQPRRGWGRWTRTGLRPTPWASPSWSRI